MAVSLIKINYVDHFSIFSTPDFCHLNWIITILITIKFRYSLNSSDALTVFYIY